MMFINLEDLSGKMEMIVFAEMIEKNPNLFEEDKIGFFAGKIDHRDAVPKIICEKAEEILEG